MAAPVITNLLAAESSLNQVPVVNITFDLQEDTAQNCSAPANGIQYSYASASGSWSDVTLHASTPADSLQSYAPPLENSIALVWNITSDIPNKDEDFYVRVKLADPSGVQSEYSTYGPFNVDTVAPSGSFTLDTYTNESSLTIPISASGSPTFYRISEDPAMTGASWTAFSGNAQITWQSATEEQKSVYVQLRDNFFNQSSIFSDTVILHTTGPTNTFLRINGSVPDVYEYTGIKVNDDGSFTPDRTASLDLYAEDLLDIQMYISGDLPAQANVETWIPYTTSVQVDLGGLDYNYDGDVNVEVTFRDEAMNTTVENQTIRLNTRLYQTANRLLRETSASYVHQVYEVSLAGASTILDETRAIQDEYTRRWEEIFYPITHDYPRNADGTIDEASCVAMNQVSNASNDAVQLSGGEVYYDEEYRPVTVDWTNDGTKDYQDRESAYLGGEKYWILDNEGYGDIDLEFEYFHLDPNSYGPPYNSLAPYNGDCLVIYDASAAGATQEVIDHTGKRSYVLLDSSKLVEISAFTGKGSEVVNLSTGYSANSNANGAFYPDTIRGTTRICMVLYSDNSHTGSGFKVKSGVKHDKTFFNYNVDEKSGEVWIHKYPNGQSATNEVRMIYDYYDTEINLDLDAGRVTFAQDPSGVVTSDYTYFVKEGDKVAEDYTRLFTSSSDDFIDYLDASMYVTPSGQSLNKVETYIHGYPTAVVPSGKMSSNFTIDKDRGLLEFSDGTSAHGDEFAFVPTGRMTLDYYYHTYKRLSNDGYGVFEFKDNTIVADSTPLFPDYTWNDIKIVNEGDAILEDGRMRFLARGYDNNGDDVIDQVLDVNRPWDIQQGTDSETYDKTAMQVSQNYTFSSLATKDQCKSILSSWQNQYFGFDLYPREKAYGRIVWVIGGTTGTNYPTTSVGAKSWSAEIEGKYYNIEV